MGNMDSAHPLVEVNVSFKFEGNPSISKGVIERTRIGDGRTDRPTDRPTRQSESSIAPPTFCGGGIISARQLISNMICMKYDHNKKFELLKIHSGYVKFYLSSPNGNSQKIINAQRRLILKQVIDEPSGISSDGTAFSSRAPCGRGHMGTQ